jgi:hypothetical protein
VVVAAVASNDHETFDATQFEYQLERFDSILLRLSILWFLWWSDTLSKAILLLGAGCLCLTSPAGQMLRKQLYALFDQPIIFLGFTAAPQQSILSLRGRCHAGLWTLCWNGGE